MTLNVTLKMNKFELNWHFHVHHFHLFCLRWIYYYYYFIIVKQRTIFRFINVSDEIVRNYIGFGRISLDFFVCSFSLQYVWCLFKCLFLGHILNKFMQFIGISSVFSSIFLFTNILFIIHHVFKRSACCAGMTSPWHTKASFGIHYT